MFKHIVAALAVAVCAFTAHAAQIDTSGLNDAQIAQLRATAAQVAAENAAGPFAKKSSDKDTDVTATMKLASTWGSQAAQAAEGFAKAINIAARELGVTVNDFLHTDAGKLTAILIVWKVAGAAFVKMLYGMLFITVGLSFARVLYLRLFTKGFEKVEYSYFGLIKGTKMVRVTKNFSELNNEGEWLMLWVMIIIIGLTVSIGAAFF